MDPDGTQREWTWVTDLAVSGSNVRELARAARARWRIENETFNTLKNQGYHFEHNFGHGQQHLSVVMAFLMMLAFLVDQVQQRCCPLFAAALDKMQTKRHLWEEIRHLFRAFIFVCFADLLRALIQGIDRQEPVLQNSS